MAPRANGLVRWLCAVTALAAIAPATAAAERAAGITGNLNLVQFDTAAPGTAGIQPITGLQTAGEKAIALDWRPATGELFLVTTPTGITSGATGRPVPTSNRWSTGCAWSTRTSRTSASTRTTPRSRATTRP